jgi:hypothetical protein
MTYLELAERIQTMTEVQLNTDVTIYDSSIDEFYPLDKDTPLLVGNDDTNDVLDTDHPYLVIR